MKGGASDMSISCSRPWDSAIPTSSAVRGDTYGLKRHASFRPARSHPAYRPVSPTLRFGTGTSAFRFGAGGSRSDSASRVGSMLSNENVSDTVDMSVMVEGGGKRWKRCDASRRAFDSDESDQKRPKKLVAGLADEKNKVTTNVHSRYQVFLLWKSGPGGTRTIRTCKKMVSQQKNCK